MSDAEMDDTSDILGKLRALLNGSGKPETPKPAIPKDRHSQRRDRGSAEVDSLILENRDLKSDIEGLRLELSKAERLSSADQTEVRRQKEVLQQAEAAIAQYQASTTSLHSELKSQSRLLASEKQAKEQSEVTMNAAKTQLSKIAKEKHELASKLARMQDDLEKLEQRAKNAEDAKIQLLQEVRTLQQRPMRPTGPQISSLQERVRVSELRSKSAEDQLKHVRLQNDALLLQVQQHNKKESHPPPQSGSGSSDTPTTLSNPIGNTALDLVRRHWDLIWSILLNYLPIIANYIPPLYRLITSIVPLVARRYKHKRQRVDRGPSESGMAVSTWTLDTEMEREKEKAGSEQKLLADKSALKQIIHDQGKEMARMKERNESLVIQNRAFVEEVKNYERAEQEHTKRKKERAIQRANQSLMVPDRSSSRLGISKPRPEPREARPTEMIQDQTTTMNPWTLGHSSFDRDRGETPMNPPRQVQGQEPNRQATSLDFSSLFTATPALDPQSKLAPNEIGARGGGTRNGGRDGQPPREGRGEIPMEILARVLGRPLPPTDPFLDLDKILGRDLDDNHCKQPQPQLRAHTQYHDSNLDHDVCGTQSRDWRMDDRAQIPARSSPEETTSSFIYGGKVV